MTKCFLEEANIHPLDIKYFCNLYKLKSWSKFHNVSKTRIITRLLNSSFQNSCALEKKLSDFHKMTGTVFKSYLEKKQPNIRFDRDLGKFSNNDFRTQILWNLSTLHLTSDYSSIDLCLDNCIRALDIYALEKKRILGAITVLLWIRLSLKQCCIALG